MVRNCQDQPGYSLSKAWSKTSEFLNTIIPLMFVVVTQRNSSSNLKLASLSTFMHSWFSLTCSDVRQNIHLPLLHPCTARPHVIHVTRPCSLVGRDRWMLWVICDFIPSNALQNTGTYTHVHFAPTCSPRFDAQLLVWTMVRWADAGFFSVSNICDCISLCSSAVSYCLPCDGEKSEDHLFSGAVP